jgi:serine/threonine protein kinase/tetratricopeptide (TPR) repeat protein
LREAQTLAQVSHPNVVQIYEAGTYSGRLFIAMELIRGKTLSSWLKDVAQVPRPVRQREILRRFIAAGRGLEAAHAAGLAHRDFKPDNVLVGDDGRVRVVDFGLARALVDELDGAVSAWSGRAHDDDREGPAGTAELSMGDISLSEAVTSRDGEGGGVAPIVSGAPTIVDRPMAADVPASRAAAADPLAKTERASTSDERSRVAGDGGTPKLKAAVRLTETGTVMGTPSYMAPETLRGAIADQRSDQFSFCVSLYHALYEAFPFTGKSLLELRASMESGKVEFVPSVPVPAFVRKALYRGLSVEPSQRFAGMGELLAALEPKARRLRSWIAVAVSLIVVVVSAVVVLRSQAPADPCAAAGAAIDAPWSADRQVAILAAFGRSDLLFAAPAWRGVKARVESYTARWRGEATAACQATNVAGTQSADQLDKRMLCLDRGQRQLDALVTELGAGASGTVEHAIEATEALPDLEDCRHAENLLFGLAPPPVPVAAQVAAVRGQIARASALKLLGHYEESLAIARAASAMAERLGYPPVHAEALAQTARVLAVQGTAEARAEAERLNLAALDIAEAERHDQLAVEVWNQLVILAVSMDSSLAQAHAWWRRNAAAVHRLGDNAYEQAKLHHALGDIDYRESKYAQAADEQRRAITEIERVPAHRVELSLYYNALANALEALDDVDAGMRLHERALAIATEALGAGHLNVINMQADYGKALEQRRQFDRSRSVLENALDNMPARYRDTHVLAARIHLYLSDLAYSQGQLDRAAEHGRASLAIYQGTQSPDHVLFVLAYMRLANIEFKRRNFEGALDQYNNALVLQRRYLGDVHGTGMCEGSIAETLVKLERYDDAMPHLKEAERIFDLGTGRQRTIQAWILTVHGEILAGQGQLGAAIPVLEDALKQLGDGTADPPNHALAMWTLARVLHGLGMNGDRVRSLTKDALVIFRSEGTVAANDRDAVAHFLDQLSTKQPR